MMTVVPATTARQLPLNWRTTAMQLRCAAPHPMGSPGCAIWGTGSRSSTSSPCDMSVEELELLLSLLRLLEPHSPGWPPSENSTPLSFLQGRAAQAPGYQQRLQPTPHSLAL